MDFGAAEPVGGLLWRERYECIWVGLRHRLYQSASVSVLQRHSGRVVTVFDRSLTPPVVL